MSNPVGGIPGPRAAAKPGALLSPSYTRLTEARPTFAGAALSVLANTPACLHQTTPCQTARSGGPFVAQLLTSKQGVRKRVHVMFYWADSK